MNPEVRLLRLRNAIKDALLATDAFPGDDVRDIWNDSLKTWGTGFRMGRRYDIDPDEP